MHGNDSRTALDDFLGVKPAGWLVRRRKWLWAIAVVLALAAGAWFVFGRKDDATTFATAEITQGDLQVTISATGNLAPTNSVDVGSELSGQVEQVYVDVNDRVRRGQAIAQIDTLRLRDVIARSEAALLQAQAGVAQSQATEQQAQATLARFEEVSRLSNGKVPSATELDSARAEYARAVADGKSARAQVASAQAQLSSDRVNLDKATIRSPVTGVVLSRQIEPGQTVAASFNTPTLFTIAEDLASMKLEVKVDEADVGQVREGQGAVFAVDAFPERQFPAEIKRVDVGANAATSSTTGNASTVVAYTAVLAVANDELLLRPGMTATAEIITQTQQDVLLVPNAALRFRPKAARSSQATGFPVMTGPPGRQQQRSKTAKVTRGSQQTLYVLGADNQPQPLPVTVGATNGTLTVVAGPDVKAGLRVITSELAPAT